MKTIVFVDDAPEILMVYRRLFERATDWRCFYVSDAESALSYLSSIHVDILVTDLEMPLFNGIQLLHIVKKEFPAIVRFIISGATMNERHFETVRLAHRFFRKPANLRSVYEAIEHSFYVQRFLFGDKARVLLGNIETIPSYPSVIDRIEKEINAPQSSLKNIGKIISEDPSLTSSILKLVNSDYFNLEHEIYSLEHAVSLIGIEGIKGVIMTHSMLEEMPMELYKTFEIGHFREHSFITAQFARAIAMHEGWSSHMVEMAFVVGLLHDIGRLVLEVSFTDTEINIQNYLKEMHGEGDLASLEKANIGISHAQAGAYLLGLWGIQNEIIEPILLHHVPSQSSIHHYPELTAVLHCADQFEFSLFPKFFSDGMEKLDHEFLKEHVSDEKVNSWRAICTKIAKESMSIKMQNC